MKSRAYDSPSSRNTDKNGIIKTNKSTRKEREREREYRSSSRPRPRACATTNTTPDLKYDCPRTSSAAATETDRGDADLREESSSAALAQRTAASSLGGPTAGPSSLPFMLLSLLRASPPSLPRHPPPPSSSSPISTGEGSEEGGKSPRYQLSFRIPFSVPKLYR